MTKGSGREKHVFFSYKYCSFIHKIQACTLSFWMYSKIQLSTMIWGTYNKILESMLIHHYARISLQRNLTLSWQSQNSSITKGSKTQGVDLGNEGRAGRPHTAFQNKTLAVKLHVCDWIILKGFSLNFNLSSTLLNIYCPVGGIRATQLSSRRGWE